MKGLCGANKSVQDLNYNILIFFGWPHNLLAALAPAENETLGP